MEQRPLSPTHVLRCIYEIDSKLRSGVRWIEAVSLWFRRVSEKELDQSFEPQADLY